MSESSESRHPIIQVRHLARIDIGVFDASGAEIAAEKRWLDSERTELSLRVSRPPASAGIDPFNKLVDRQPDDNVIPVERQ